MKKKIIFLFLLCFMVSQSLASELREWTREADGAKIQAELLAFDAATGKATLKMETGKEYQLAPTVFVQADRDFLAEFAKQQAEKKAAILKAAEKARLERATPPNGGGHKVHVYKPKGYLDGDESEKNRPVAFLYSAGGNSMSLVNRLKPVADDLGWLLIGIDAYHNTSSVEDKYDERMENTKAAFDWALENLVFDEKKIVFGGMSGGGWWSYQSASDLTKDAAGILAFGGWMGNMHDKKYSKKMAVAMINGDKDKNAIHYESVDGDFLDKKARATIKVFHFPGGHELAPATVALEAAKWIHKTKEF